MSNDIENTEAKTPAPADHGGVDYNTGSVEKIPGGLATIHMPGVDAMFEEQAALINNAIQTIGMGKYQWHLFILCGFGWLCDPACLAI